MSHNHKETVYVHHTGKSNRHNRLRSCTRDVLTCHVTIRKPSMSTTSGPSSSCEMIISRNNSHGVIIRVCMGIFTAALRNKIIRQILKKNTSPYFYTAGAWAACVSTYEDSGNKNTCKNVRNVKFGPKRLSPNIEQRWRPEREKRLTFLKLKISKDGVLSTRKKSSRKQKKKGIENVNENRRNHRKKER